MKKGFTLIELLIVIAIIGILAGVILVSTSSARNKAQVASGLQSLKSLMAYSIDCINRDGTVNSVIAPLPGDPLCDAETDILFPEMPTGCSYANGTATTIVANCGSPIVVITCDFGNGGDCQQS